jgi:phosphate transport system protein
LGERVSTHTDKAYERDLRTLREQLLAMGERVEAMIAECVLAIADRDSALAEHVLKSDIEVNQLELEIDDLCRRIIALRQPAASDLRLITTALKIVTDLERVGDLAVNIAERALDLNQAASMPIYGDFPKLAGLAQNELEEALQAFVKGDVEQAERVLKSDDLLDALFVKLFNDLLQLMMEDSKTIRRATSLLFVAKHLERIGDHAMNVAEMVIYLVKGTDVRHPRSRAAARSSSRVKSPSGATEH